MGFFSSSPQDDVLSRYKAYVDQHVRAIKLGIHKGKKELVMPWFSELIQLGKEAKAGMAAKEVINPTGEKGWTHNLPRIDMREVSELNKLRYAYVVEQVKKAKNMIRKTEWG